MSKIKRIIFIAIAVPSAIAILCWLVIAIIDSSSRKYMYEDAMSAPSTQAALILGAAVLRNGDLSSVLKDRADQAIELYRVGKVQTIIASGNSTPDYNEVQPIKNYLLKNDIPETAILLDYGGLDTYSSIYRAREVFAITSLSIVSQSFHLPRAVFIARSLGIEANGVSADRGHYKLFNYFREMFADLKAAADLLFDRRPATAAVGSDQPGAPVPLLRQTTIPLW